MPQSIVLKFIEPDVHSTSGRFLLFQNPEYNIQCHDSQHATSCLREIDLTRKKGLHVAGYFSYESLNSIHEIGQTKSNLPLIWMGAYRDYQILEADEIESVIKNLEMSHPNSKYKFANNKELITPCFTVHDRNQNSKNQYQKHRSNKKKFLDAVTKIKEKLQAGDTYQINFTITSDWYFDGNPISLFRDLHKLQPTNQSSLILHDDRAILSHSPESFFTITQQHEKLRITSKPMKGTASRNRNPQIDKTNLSQLKKNPKTKAENLMIVDLMRNDLGHIGISKSVATNNLFDTQTHPTLHQMTSQVEAVIDTNTNNDFFQEAFPSLFPAGSITGAPKLSSQKIIQELENKDRGIYTGCMGYALSQNASTLMIEKNGNDSKTTSHHLKHNIPIMDFNVAIRTIDVHLSKSQALFGSGCGIVHDSDPVQEWSEFLLKSAFLRPAFSSFHLIETFLLVDGDIPLLNRHLNRLAKSIKKGFQRDDWQIEKDIKLLKNKLQDTSNTYAKGRFKIRVGIYQNHVELESIALLPKSQNVGVPTKNKVLIASEAIDSTDPFQFCKSSQRIYYDVYFQEALTLGYQDVIFLNERSEVVEGATNNIIIYSSQKKWLTPNSKSGALGGVGLASLMSKHHKIRKATLYLNDVKDARGVFLINSVRGLRRVFIDSTHPLVLL